MKNKARLPPRGTNTLTTSENKELKLMSAYHIAESSPEYFSSKMIDLTEKNPGKFEAIDESVKLATDEYHRIMSPERRNKAKAIRVRMWAFRLIEFLRTVLKSHAAFSQNCLRGEPCSQRERTDKCSCFQYVLTWNHLERSYRTAKEYSFEQNLSHSQYFGIYINTAMRSYKEFCEGMNPE